jgi:voltage-gated potassium channel Kch
MHDRQTASPSLQEYQGTFRDGYICLDAPVNWPAGTRVVVRMAPFAASADAQPFGPVIIAGFGLPGRWVADIFDRHGIEYRVVDNNPETVRVQQALGRTVIQGDISEEETLVRSGVEQASILALTVPNEPAVLKATELARKLNPGIYIVARTTHSSAGMEASRLGADEVVKAEQAVARQFYEMLLRKLNSHSGPSCE